MPWPANDLSTQHFDSGTDSPGQARPMLHRLIQRVQTIIGGRGTADGVCELDSAGRVPGRRIAKGVAGGVASLGSDGRVPADQLPTGVGVIPIGGITPYAGTALPEGWLWCDGAAYPRGGAPNSTTYAALLAAIGPGWGASTPTTWRVPDLRGRVLYGAGGAGSAALPAGLGSRPGAATHAMTVAEMPSHRHRIYGRGNAHDSAVDKARLEIIVDDDYLDVEHSPAETAMSATGGGAAFSLVQPSVAINWIIRYR